jgi:aminoglycoside 2'-N-acetyltransferase I
MRVVVSHTGDLDAAVLRSARDLLDDVFDGELDDHDWEHALGGVHALALVDGEPVAHASLIMRRLLHGGRWLRAGYVEGVGVRADVRRQGLGGAVMAPLERLGAAAYDVVALASTDEALAFYRGRGWLPWRGEAYALKPDGVVRTPDADDCLHVLPGAGVDPTAALTCDWREGDVW